MNGIDLEKFFIRTDLAFEALDIYKTNNDTNVYEDNFEENNIFIKRTVINDIASQKIGKKSGVYYSIDITSVKTHDHDELVNCENVLTKVIKEVLKLEGINNKSKGLVVGLGNINVTPDSLGPLVVDNVIVTRHMFLLDPGKVSEGISEVSAISPGVMGTTGIETVDIIESVVNKIKVDYVIAVDALASRSIARVNNTIQVTNTGISPGSGVGNKRKELSKETIGIPVIAIGVPTVVDAVSIASDTVNFMLKYFNRMMNEKPKDKLSISLDIDFEKEKMPNEEYKKEFLGQFGVLDEDSQRELINEVLTPNGYNMMVTPKEVDLDIEDLCSIISGAIDRALHTIVSEPNV